MFYTIIINIFTIILLVLPSASFAELPRTGQRTCYDQEGNIIEHTGTGQDGDFQAGKVWPDPRFQDNGDGTITDLLNGLMWIKNGSCMGWLSWQGAMNAARELNSMDKVEEHCANLLVAYDDWYLPTIQELEILLNAEAEEPYNFLNFYGFSAVQADSYWSSTAGPNPYSAWLLHLDSGEITGGGKVETHHILLVRKDKIGIEQPAPVKTVQTVKSERFVDNGDGTVTDTETELMWLKDVSCIEPLDWQAGLDAVEMFNEEPVSYNCQDLTALSYNDWALPNRNELRSLISYSIDLPALASDFPVDRIQPYYWTSTTMTGHPEMAYDMYMGTGALSISPKRDKKYIWPVRPANGRTERQRVPDKTQTMELTAEHYLLRPIGNRIDIDWPAKRFTDHGDGTVIDNLTGLMWLKDASCLGKYSWQEAFLIIRRLNNDPARIECAEYTAGYANWQFPDMNKLENIFDGVQGEPAEWLNQQGTVKAQARDYWSLSENPHNLYHAWAMNMLKGGGRNYPKSFVLYVWPYRQQLIIGPVNPTVSILGNGKTDTLHLSLSQELLLSVSVDYNNGAVLSDFRIWYDAPDGTVWWLTANGQWHQDERIVFHGNMFDLDEFTAFHAGTSNLAPGEYVFHFSVTPVLDTEQTPIVFSSDLVLTLEEAASTEDEIDDEVTVLVE